jgi:hypothetical protein
MNIVCSQAMSAGSAASYGPVVPLIALTSRPCTASMPPSEFRSR